MKHQGVQRRIASERLSFLPSKDNGSSLAAWRKREDEAGYGADWEVAYGRDGSATLTLRLNDRRHGREEQFRYRVENGRVVEAESARTFNWSDAALLAVISSLVSLTAGLLWRWASRIQKRREEINYAKYLPSIKPKNRKYK